MRTVEINLATRPFRNNTLYWAGFGSAVLALAAVSVVNVWFFLGYGSTMRQHREDLSSKQQRHEALARDERQLSVKLTRLDFKGLSQQSDFANDAIRRRIFSWTELFNRLEEVVPPAVMMISIRPEIQAEGISVVAEGSAKDQEGLLQFEENLIRNPRFARLYPGSERREQRGQDLRFSLKFDYVPDSSPRTAAAPAPKGPEPPAQEPAAQVTPVPPPAVAGAGAAPTPGSAGANAQGTPPVAALPPPSVPAAAPAPSPAPAAVSPPAVAPVPAATSTPASSPPPAVSPRPAGQGTAPQQRPASPPPQQARPRPGGRPPLKPGSMSRPGARADAATRSEPAPGKKAGEEAVRFANRPLQDVFDYLMKDRSMTFVFAGDFDLGQNVTLDLTGKDEREVLEILSRTLDCLVTREGSHAYRLSPKSGGEPLEEPPVVEEPAPPEDGGQETGGDARDPGKEPGQDAGQESGQDAGQDPGQDAGQDPGQEEPR